LFSRGVEVSCAGRTDAGVHALGQVVGLADAPDEADLLRVRDALNGMCGPAIAVWSCRSMPDDWHARFSARSRLYRYSIYEGDVLDPFFVHTALHHKQALDVDAMSEAAGHLLGERDFSSFGRPASPDATTVRTLFELRVERRDRFVTVRARATSFIQQMVRSLVGTLVQVGEGKRGPDQIPGILEARDRAAAGPVAPPHGLCLVSVEYDEGWSRPL
jgi:tRNA pseudouridine38-40 synthase